MLRDPSSIELGEVIGEIAVAFDRASLGREIGLAACRAIPQLGRSNDPELVEETVLAATSNVVAIIDGLLAGAAPDAIPVPSVSLQWIDWLVARHIDVAAVPWAYNLGNGRMAEALREVVHGLEVPVEERLALAEGLTRYVQSYVESISAQMVAHYERIQRERRGDASARRRTLITALLAGETLDLDGVGRELGYALDRPHVAAIVWAVDPDAPDRPAPGALEAAAELLLRSCGAVQVLKLVNGDASVWAWGSGPSLSDSLGDRVLVEAGMLGALGTIGCGPTGFAASHQDAQRARQMARLLDKRPRSIVPYRAVALTALIAQDPEQAARFVESELGALVEPTDSARRLRATLAVYLDEGMRPVRAARRLGVHQNTVAYRVSQAEAAIGHPLTERRLELETALQLADALETLRGAPALGTAPQTGG